MTELQQTLAMPWLPAQGALLFFYDLERQPWGFDPKDRGAFAVLHVPDLDPAAEPDAPAIGPSLPYRGAGFRRIDTLPSYERDAIAALALSDDESDLLEEVAASCFGGLPKHQVGGYPAPVQNDDMELQAQLAAHGIDCGGPAAHESAEALALAPGARHWKLLFQFDTDDGLDVMWGDGGTLYFWVEEERARKGDFSDAWLILQCG